MAISEINLILVAMAYLTVLILANIVVFHYYSKRVFRMTFEDGMTISALEDRLTFIINNGGDDQPKIVKAYGHNGPASIDISGSEFVDADSSNKVEIKFDPSGSTSKLVDSIGTVPQPFEVYVTNSYPNPGAYHGNIFITSAGNQASLPFLIDVKEQIARLLMIVIDGIALAIAAWSAIRFLSGNEPSIKAYLDNKMTWRIITKQTILNSGTIAFAIALGLTTLFDNNIITGIHNLGTNEVISLIGIGLGIGSLKEIVFKA